MNNILPALSLSFLHPCIHVDQIIFENGKLIIYCLFINKNRSDKFFLDFGSVPPLILRVIYIWIISCKCPKVCQHLANNIFLNHFSYISRIFLFVLRLKYSSDIFWYRFWLFYANISRFAGSLGRECKSMKYFPSFEPIQIFLRRRYKFKFQS